MDKEELAHQLDYCVNHVEYSLSDNYSSIINSLLSQRFEDELSEFRVLFHEALSDESLSAHTMLPTTPGRKQGGFRTGNEKVTSARPPLAENRGKKRPGTSKRTESRRKRVSMISELHEESSNMSDISISSQMFDFSSITTQLSDQEDAATDTSVVSKQRTLRGSNKKLLPIETDNREDRPQDPGETVFTRQRSLRVRKKQLEENAADTAVSKQQKPDGKLMQRHVRRHSPAVRSENINSQVDNQPAMVIEDVEMKSPDVTPHSPPCTSIASTPPERPVLPSSTFLEESSIPSIPPTRPSPPAIVSSQKDAIPGPPVSTQDSTSSAPDEFLSLVVEQSVSQPNEIVQNSEEPSIVIQQDSLDRSNHTTAAVSYISRKEAIIQEVKSLTLISPQPADHPVTSLPKHDTSPHVDTSPILSDNIPIIPIPDSHTADFRDSHTPPQTIDNKLSPDFSECVTPSDTHNSPRTPSQTSDKLTSDISVSHNSSYTTDKRTTDFSENITPSDTHTSPHTPPQPADNPITTPSDTTRTYSEEVFVSVSASPYPGPDHTHTISETPSNLTRIPAPTPSKTFSIQKHYDSDLCITPPSDLVCKSSKPFSHHVVQSPLLEQHPDPSMFLSKYDHENAMTPVNPRPVHLPAGGTHSILKNKIPINSNTPSKFHSKCSPQYNPIPLTNTPLQRPQRDAAAAARESPSRKCKLLVSKNITLSHPITNIPNLSISSKLKKDSPSKTKTKINQPAFLSPSNSSSSIVQVTNSSLQNIPHGLVSTLAGKFQTLQHDKQPGKLAISVSSFLKKKPVNPPVKNPEENKVKLEQKEHDNELRVGGLMAMKQKLLDKKKQENIKRQQEAAERRAEIIRKQKEKVNQRLDNKEEKLKQWERQSLRKKKAEEERRKREETDKRRVEEKRQLEKSQVQSSNTENASTTFNTSSFMSTTQCHNDFTSYQIDDLDSDNTDDEDHPRHPVPSWATEPYLQRRLHSQCTGSADPNVIFPSCYLLQPMELTLLFEYNRYRRCKRPYNYRTSSAHWTSPMWKPS